MVAVYSHGVITREEVMGSLWLEECFVATLVG